jgi:hypothetical protein
MAGDGVEPPMSVRAWLNFKRNTVALAVFLRRAFVFLTIAIGVRCAAAAASRS